MASTILQCSITWDRPFGSKRGLDLPPPLHFKHGIVRRFLSLVLPPILVGQPKQILALIGNAAERLFPPQNVKNIEYAWRGCSPRERGPQRLGDIAELDSGFFGIGP